MSMMYHSQKNYSPNSVICCLKYKCKRWFGRDIATCYKSAMISVLERCQVFKGPSPFSISHICVHIPDYVTQFIVHLQ